LVVIQKALFFSFPLLLDLIQQANLALKVPVQGILLADDSRPLRVRGSSGGDPRRPRVLHVLVEEELVLLHDIRDFLRQSRLHQGLGILEFLVAGFHLRQLEVIVVESGAAQGGLGAVQGTQKLLHVEGELVLPHHLDQDVQNGKNLLELARGIEGAAQALLAHLGLRGVADLVPYLDAQLAPLQIVLLQVAHLHCDLLPVQAHLLPDQERDVLDQHHLQGVGGLARLHQALQQTLELARVFPQGNGRVPVEAGIGKEAVLERVLAHSPLALRRARARGFLGHW
jgi:hypothetical protein